MPVEQGRVLTVSLAAKVHAILSKKGEFPVRHGPTAAVPMENPYRSCKRTRRSTRSNESWLTAAVPMENPYCSCNLTRVHVRS